ncbi:MAG: hypothetical protein K9L70_04655 [Thiohalocapsa sp.]|jgi:hypothetical protein|nr:hypothetical protein [Thiohalocapsa sp.]
MTTMRSTHADPPKAIAVRIRELAGALCERHWAARRSRAERPQPTPPGADAREAW